MWYYFLPFSTSSIFLDNAYVRDDFDAAVGGVVDGFEVSVGVFADVVGGDDMYFGVDGADDDGEDICFGIVGEDMCFGVDGVGEDIFFGIVFATLYLGFYIYLILILILYTCK